MKQLAILFSGICILMLLCISCPAAVEPDTQLDMKVTIQAQGQPLSTFLTALRIQTGVQATATKDVADYKITVLARDLPLSQLFAGIADALHIRQKSMTGDDGKPQYEFYEDKASKDEASRLYTQSKTALSRQMDHAADVIRQNLPEDQLEQKIKEDAFLSPYIGDKDFRVAVEVYSQLDAKARNRLWQVGTEPVPLTRISEATRQKVTALFDRNRQQREEADKVKLSDKVASLQFEAQDDPLSGRSLSFQIIGTGTHGMTYVFVPSDENGLNLLGNDSLFVVKTDPVSGDFSAESVKLEGRLAQKSQVKFPDEIAMIPALLKVSEAEKISIISDHFTSRYVAQANIDKWSLAHGDTLADVIERIGEVFACTWKPVGDAYILSSKSWYEDRMVEVPMSTIQRWQGARQRQTRFELPQFLEMAGLSDKQQRSLRSYGISLPDSFLYCARALRFYSTLAPSERDMAASDVGLSVDKLAPDQKQQLVNWLLSPIGPERTPSTFTEEMAATAKVRVFRNESGDWIFHAEATNGGTRDDVLKLS